MNEKLTVVDAIYEIRKQLDFLERMEAKSTFVHVDSSKQIEFLSEVVQLLSVMVD